MPVFAGPHTRSFSHCSLGGSASLPPQNPTDKSNTGKGSITCRLAEPSTGSLDDHITNESLFWTKAAPAVLDDTTLNHAALGKHQIGLHAEEFTKDWATLPAKRRKQTQGLGR